MITHTFIQACWYTVFVCVYYTHAVIANGVGNRMQNEIKCTIENKFYYENKSPTKILKQRRKYNIYTHIYYVFMVNLQIYMPVCIYLYILCIRTYTHTYIHMHTDKNQHSSTDSGKLAKRHQNVCNTDTHPYNYNNTIS